MVHLLYPQREFLASIGREPDVTAILGKIRQHHLGTYQHSCRVAHLAADIAMDLGPAEGDLCLLTRAGYLHDTGKLIESVDLLDARRKLDNYEKEEMHLHAFWTIFLLTQRGYNPSIVGIAGSHHEWQSDPYPRKNTSSREEPNVIGKRRVESEKHRTLSQILALADHVDALATKRAYKDPFPPATIEQILYQDFTGEQSLIPLAMKRVS
ncbi:HD domain-containing protein [Candidatus Woesearchaeota archaeon]|nr:HD domain-containing protein [Candidatus Woesearchaeota archaeon]